jgi:hypothetical protein
MINMLMKLYIIVSSIVTTLNIKTQNFKVVYLSENYNFDIKVLKSYDFSKVESCHVRPSGATKQYCGVRLHLK